MADEIVKAKKIGGSIMILVQKDIIDIEKINEGDTLQVSIKKIKPSFFGAFPTLTPFDKEKDRARSKYD